MKVPLQISLHGIAHSDALHDAIRENAERLNRYYDRVMSCRVVVEPAGRHKRHGRQFTARGVEGVARATPSTPRAASSRTTRASSAAM